MKNVCITLSKIIPFCKRCINSFTVFLEGNSSVSYKKDIFYSATNETSFELRCTRPAAGSVAVVMKIMLKYFLHNVFRHS